MSGMGLKQFLAHKSGGGNGRWLRFWGKTGRCEIWLHQCTDFHPVWYHSWPRVQTFEDRKTHEDRTVVRNSRYVSHDPERVLKKARFRDDDGRRENPPLLDPMAIMVEWFAEEIISGRMSWTTPVFKFEGDDEEENVTLYAGGMCGMFGSRDLSKEQQSQLRKIGINHKNAFKQSLLVGCYYLFQVVDEEDPGGGVVLALEKSTTTGDKLQALIRDRMEEDGEEGNPCVTPYPFVFVKNADEKNPSKIYEVKALRKKRPSAEVLELISDPKTLQDVDDVVAKADLVQFRSELETHALIKMPFDDFFEAADKAGLMKSKAGATSAKKTAQKPAAAPEVGRSAAKAPSKQDDDEEEDDEDEPVLKEGDDTTGPCDVCEEQLGPDDLVCPKCGATYEDDGKNVVLDGIPCKDCKTVVPLKDGTSDGAATKFICPSCATIHKFERVARKDDNDLIRWDVVERHPKAEDKPAPAKRGGGRRGGAAKSEPAASAESKAIDDKLEGDDIPW